MKPVAAALSVGTVVMLAKVDAALFKPEGEKIDAVPFLPKVRREQVSSLSGEQRVRMQTYKRKRRHWMR